MKNLICCDEQNYIIWKWRPDGKLLGESKRENGIRWGSYLRVREGEVAVLVYPQIDGPQQDYIYGPFDRILETDNLPVLADIMGLVNGGNAPFQAEVYFINLADIIQVRFGVPFFDVFDSVHTAYSVPVAVRGVINFRIEEIERFIRLHKLANFTMEDFQKKIKATINRYVKDIVCDAPEKYGVSVLQLERKMTLINEEIELVLSHILDEDYGIFVTGLDINAMEIDKDSDDYQNLLAIARK